ncbi:MAG: hypothetical protein COY66_04765 [Candidatus Kerfeldbacteria bacterium CG_4_10_14_0_8_um_filter_42_10]|uniref:Uncharacterized protein n=1 Tax=Candidatus Kerfeldbacteria bacterium CG_4_10_14_0_8_um_filter_42_10 TaxID=2014248 RepID=A0A2M7RI06_9BACT|nr:MAG: hypothetical protein COY66_04765 [Candidatus Kerfeldbacteria bacterium CG_4_10_14_0_8_um_filter_42_10]
MQRFILVALLIALVATIGYCADLPIPQVKGYDGEFWIKSAAPTADGKTIVVGIYNGQGLGRWIGLVEKTGFLWWRHDDYAWVRIMDVQETSRLYYVSDVKSVSDGFLMIWGPKEEDPRIAKFDLNGNMVWEESLKGVWGPGWQSLILSNLYKTSDGFLLTGATTLGYYQPSDAFIAKLDNSGKRVLWKRTLDFGGVDDMGTILNPDEPLFLVHAQNVRIPYYVNEYEAALYLIKLTADGRDDTTQLLKETKGRFLQSYVLRSNHNYEVMILDSNSPSGFGDYDTLPPGISLDSTRVQITPDGKIL